MQTMYANYIDGDKDWDLPPAEVCFVTRDYPQVHMKFAGSVLGIRRDRCDDWQRLHIPREPRFSS